MEKNKKSKMRIAFIAAGVLLISSAMLVTAILAVGNAEENKIVRTAYAQEGAAKEEVLETADDAAEQESESTQLADTAESTDDTVMQENAVVQTNEPPAVETAVETPAPVATGDQVYEPGPENITADEAVSAFLETAGQIFGLELDIDKDSLSVEFDRSGYSVLHDVWSVSDEHFTSVIDAISGEVLIFHDQREYSGNDNFSNFSDEEFREFSKEIVDNPNNNYIEISSKIVYAQLADGRKIDEVFVDAIQAVYGSDGQIQTVQVDCRVLMESGRSYSFSFEGTELILKWFYSHPSQQGCLWGFIWEEEAAEYSEWQTAPGVTASESSPMPTPPPMPSPTPRPTAAPAS